MTPVSDLAAYNKALARSLSSKLFWVDKVPVADLRRIIDVGCGDGTVLKALGRAWPHVELVGIDSEVRQLQEAFDNLHGHPGGVSLLADPGALMGSAEDRRHSLVLLSSVMHEVLSTPGLNWRDWWQEVENMGATWIVVRDMALPGYVYRRPVPPYFSVKFWEWCMRLSDADKLRYAQFARRWGHATASQDTLHHFLLKWPYADNWERELEENYVKWSAEEYRLHLTSGAYEVVYFAQNSTPNYVDRLKEVCVHHPPSPPTHVQMILKRKAAWPRRS